MHSSNRGKLAVLAIAVAVATALVALPGTAFAATKASTKFVVASSQVVHHDTGDGSWAGTTLSATLYKKSGTKWVGFAGDVRLYELNPETGAYIYQSHKKTSSKGTVSLSISDRGKYRLTFLTTSTLKAATGYSTVYETIGDSISIVQGYPTFTPVAGSQTQTWVSVQYNVNWNTAAWDGPVVVGYLADLESNTTDDYYEWVSYDREMLTPGIVEFNYKVNTSHLLDVLWASASPYVQNYWTPYIRTSSTVEDVYPTH